MYIKEINKLYYNKLNHFILNKMKKKNDRSRLHKKRNLQITCSYITLVIIILIVILISRVLKSVLGVLIVE